MVSGIDQANQVVVTIEKLLCSARQVIAGQAIFRGDDAAVEAVVFKEGFASQGICLFYQVTMIIIFKCRQCFITGIKPEGYGDRGGIGSSRLTVSVLALSSSSKGVVASSGPWTNMSIWLSP